jgi:hypothetical protein
MKSAFLFQTVAFPFAWFACVAWLATGVGTGVASAADLPCGPAEKDAITLDGLTDDWSDVPGVDAAADGDASFTLKCNTIDDRTLALLIDVHDGYFVRTPRAAPGEDHLELTLGGKKLVIFPGDADKLKDKVTPPAGVRLVSALQPKGFAVEMFVPLSSVPGWKKGLPSLALSVKFLDCDSKSALKTEHQPTLDGHIVFAESDASLDAFLQDRRLTRAQVYWDQPMALGKKSGARAVLAGRYLAVLSDGFVFLELPFAERKDLHDIKLLDLAGDGREALVMRYAERGGTGAPTKGGGAAGPVSGTREVLAVYRAAGDEQVARVFACEVGKSAGANRLDNKISFVKRGRATDIVIEAGAATGFSQANYHETPAQDMLPILLPWGEERRARYQFSGDEYRRAD